MCNKTWQNRHEQAHDLIVETANNSMHRYANEDFELALKRGDFVVDKYNQKLAFITIEADGEFMKRWYPNSRYDSPSFCVVIFSIHTGKIIQIKVLQKTCSICDRADR